MIHLVLQKAYLTVFSNLVNLSPSFSFSFPTTRNSSSSRFIGFDKKDAFRIDFPLPKAAFS